MWCIKKTKFWIDIIFLKQCPSSVSSFNMCFLVISIVLSLETFSKGASYFFHVIFTFRAYNFSITSSHFSLPGIFSLPLLLSSLGFTGWYYVFIFVNKSEKIWNKMSQSQLLLFVSMDGNEPEMWQTDALKRWTFPYYFLFIHFFLRYT